MHTICDSYKKRLVIIIIVIKTNHQFVHWSYFSLSLSSVTYRLSVTLTIYGAYKKWLIITIIVIKTNASISLAIGVISQTLHNPFVCDAKSLLCLWRYKKTQRKRWGSGVAAYRHSYTASLLMLNIPNNECEQTSFRVIRVG